MSAPKLSVLAFGAHPDDIELGCGGLLALCAERGQPAGAIDLTRGEGASRGSVAEREVEAAQAAGILGLTVRENLALPDLHLADTLAARRLVADLVRKYRVDLILAPAPADRHPDHAAASAFVTHGAFLARMARFATDHPPHAPAAVLYYLLHELTAPSFVVDISAVWERKRAAIAAYESQFDRAMPEGYRFIGTRDYHAASAARAGAWGAQIGTAQGEPYLLAATLRVDDPVALLVEGRPC
jgi:bacillithiol biosynthesis deacetylase BshB1